MIAVAPSCSTTAFVPMLFPSSAANLPAYRMVCWTWWILLFSRILQAGAQLNNETSPTHRFKSRPDLHAPILDIAILRPELVTPGYIFLAPYRNLDPGPYIYDNVGNLIWSGAGQSGPKPAHTPRVCMYKGGDHLCYFQGEQHQGYARGHGFIMDQKYRVVKIVESSGAGANGDMHEFRIAPHSDNKTTLMTVYQPRQYDLTSSAGFDLQHGLSWIVDGVFQEIDIETGRVVFEWRFLDHVDPLEAWTLPGTTDTSGDGRHEQSPWDYFHINFIDKNKDGDYLLSARHVSAIYKIAGQDGHIIWQLGGDSPDFVQTNFQFSYQHHARWIADNSTHTELSFFDNTSNSYDGTGTTSRGCVIRIDHTSETATMTHAWGPPVGGGGLLSTSQGNIQMLPNGGCHIGWEENACFSEYTANGRCVQFVPVAQRSSNVMIYRSNKYNWTAQPVTKPALWTYSKFGGSHDDYARSARSRTSFWVSWNGATEVRKWKFFIGGSAAGPWSLAGSVVKDGFKTEFHLNEFALWSYAEALNEFGQPLDVSVIAKTFVPSETLRSYCDNQGCDSGASVSAVIGISDQTHGHVEEVVTSPQRGFNTSHYYKELLSPTIRLQDPGWTTTYKYQAWSEGPQRDDLMLAVSSGILIGVTLVTIAHLCFHTGGLSGCRMKRAAFGHSSWRTGTSSRMLGQYMRVREGDVSEFGSSTGSTGLCSRNI